MRRISAIATILAAMLAVAASPAGAAHRVPITHCRIVKSIIPPDITDAQNLRIQMAATRVDGYLPRCDLATFVAADSGLHRRVVEHGARWSVGWFTCTYRYHGDRVVDETVISTRCVHTGRYAATVWFDSYA